MLNKAIFYGKEHRKPYVGSKAFDPACRNHGGCPWCEENRKHKFIKTESATEKELKEFLTYVIAQVKTIEEETGE